MGTEPGDELTDAARKLVEGAAAGGRWSHTLTEEDVRRGAAAVANDPVYRQGVYLSAVRHAEQCCTHRPLLAGIIDANVLLAAADRQKAVPAAAEGAGG